MPEYVRYLLYIDSDTVICDSVREIIDLDMGETVIAGALGVNQYGLEGESQNGTEMNLKTNNQKYLACGIVYYDIQNWKKNNCEQLIANTCKLGLEFKLADQSLINNALPDYMFSFFPPEYNYWGHCFPEWDEVREMKRGGWYTDEIIQKMIEHPVIIHYKGLFFRPWLDGCVSRKKDIYISYKEKTPWRDDPQGSLKQIINKKTIREKFHLYFALAYSKAPNKFWGNLIMNTKKLITRIF